MGTKPLIGGMLIGTALLAGVVAYVATAEPASTGEVEAADTTTTTSVVTSESNPVYVDTTEVVVGPAVLVPLGVRFSGRQTSIDFDLYQLTPVSGLPPGARFVPFQGFVEVDPAEAEVVFPTDWSLLVDGTEVQGSVANPDARSARFDLPEAVTASRIESAWIDAYRVRIPLDIPFSLSSSEPQTEVVPGVVATLIQVSDQSDSAIVRVELRTTDPLNLAGLDVAGAGPGVVSSNREAEGGPRWNITFEDNPGDAGWQFTLVGTLWHTVVDRIDVPLEGFDG